MYALFSLEWRFILELENYLKQKKNKNGDGGIINELLAQPRNAENGGSVAKCKHRLRVC